MNKEKLSPEKYGPESDEKIKDILKRLADRLNLNSRTLEYIEKILNGTATEPLDLKPDLRPIIYAQLHHEYISKDEAQDLFHELEYISKGGDNYDTIFLISKLLGILEKNNAKIRVVPDDKVARLKNE